MSENNIEENISQLTEQQKVRTLEHFEQQRHQYIVQGINDGNGISNFDCEWIDNQSSPHRATYEGFPSDIELGLDGVNVGSNHHMQMNHIDFNIHNDVSINNQSQFNQSKNYEVHQQSYMSNDNNGKEKNMNILGDDLAQLNDSKEIEMSQNGFEKSQNHSKEDFFDRENNMISQIQPSDQHYQGSQNIQSNQQNKCEINQLNQNSIIDHSNKQNPFSKESISTKNQQQYQQSSQQKIQEPQIVRQESHSRSSTDKQNTVLINQNSILSKIYEDLSSTDHSKLLKSMAHYIQTNQTSYKPYYTLLENLFSNSKLTSDKSIENFNMYAEFFKQKTKQIQKYLKQAQSQKTQKIFQNLKTKQINNLVYVDTKVVLRDIHERNIKKVKLYRIFYKQIQQISTDFKKTVTEVYERRHSLEKQINNGLSLIKSLQIDLQKMIEYRVNYERMKLDSEFNIAAKSLFNVQNPHVAKDQYLQVKVIIQKQAFYISKLKQLRVEVIKYITLTFLTDDIFVSAKIKENLINYTQLLIEVQKFQKSNKQNSDDLNNNENSYLQILQRKKNTLNQKKIYEQLKIELTKRLYSCIPEVLKQQIGLNQTNHETSTQEILQSLNNHFQNQVFFPSIQLDDQFVFYTSEGIWISRDQYKEFQESKKISNSQQKQNINEEISKKITLKLVLTVNKYLHMEQNEKIATLKLNQIKIAKKKDYLIISDRGKGIVGFLVNNGNQLGRIKFNSIEEIDNFAQKLRQLVQQK